MAALTGGWPVAVALAAGFVLLLAPGVSWRRAGSDPLASALLDVSWSVLATTVCGLALAACGLFSLGRLLVAVAIVAALGVVRRSFAGRRASARVSPRWRGWRSLGPLLAAAALAIAWPPYETHVAGTDSTAYVSAGAYLARSGQLSRRDAVVGELTGQLRKALFRPALGGPDKPPYVRHPGATHLASSDDGDLVVRPNFFPAPMVWSAIFAAVAGPRLAGGYAPLFAGLSLWAVWAFARRRMSGAGALAVAALVGLNLAGYWSARFALSEPLACFFVWSGLVALDAWDAGRDHADALSAGALLGTVGLVRVDYTVFLIVALLLRRAFARGPGDHDLPVAFASGFVALLCATVAEVALVPGGYVLPLTETWSSFAARATSLWEADPLVVVAALLVASLVGAAIAWRLGLVRTACLGAVSVYLVGYTVFASQPRPMRSAQWLAQGLGIVLPVLAAGGALLLWRSRQQRATDGFVVLLTVSVAFVLVYNPHVQPFLLWALRRFVPVVIPALLVMAALAAEWLRVRHRWVGFGAWLALVATVLWPAHALWGAPLYRGAYDQLVALEGRIEDDAVLLIDARLSPYMAGTPLWLLYDRDNIAVDVATPRGRELTARVAARLAARRPVWLMEPRGRGGRDLVGFVPLSRSEVQPGFAFELLFPDGPDRSGVVGSRTHVMPVSVYALQPLSTAGATAAQPPAHP